MRASFGAVPALAGGLLVATLIAASGCGDTEDPRAAMAAGRGRVLLGPALASLGEQHVEGVKWVRWERAPAPVRSTLLEGNDGRRAAAALREAGIDGVLVALAEPPAARGRDAGSGTVHGRLAAARHVAGWRGVLLRPEAVLYEPADVHEPTARERAVIGQVARGILEGRRPPRITSFPPAWRRIRTSEVMVAVRTPRGKLRLWRSARASSMARALLTACSVARQRWMEREEALGGPIEEVLPRMRVEVALLLDDGTLLEHGPAFLDRVVTKEHGVGFEQGGGWHYVLPEGRQGVSASRALAQLVERQGLPSSALQRGDVRVYRFVVVPLAESGPDPLLVEGAGEGPSSATGSRTSN